ncbi:MAG: hypothetical protein AB3N11_13015 [Arenibacterium sp.]
MLNVRLIPYCSRLTITFLVFVFCPSQASVWVFDDARVDAEFSDPSGPETALPIPPQPRGSENQTARHKEDKGAGRFEPEWPRPNHTKYVRDKLRFSATLPKEEHGKGTLRRKTMFFQKKPHGDYPVERLAPGNCEGWKFAMTHVAAIGCAGLKVWTGLRAGHG